MNVKSSSLVKHVTLASGTEIPILPLAWLLLLRYTLIGLNIILTNKVILNRYEGQPQYSHNKISVVPVTLKGDAYES